MIDHNWVERCVVGTCHKSEVFAAFFFLFLNGHAGKGNEKLAVLIRGDVTEISVLMSFK